MLLNVAFNVIIPVIILSKLSAEDKLGVQTALIAALAFPVIYGLKDYFTRGKINFFSIIGVISVMLTGGMALLELPPKYIAIKEAAIPGLIGIGVLISLKTPFPAVKTFLQKMPVLDLNVITEQLQRNNTVQQYEKTLVHTTYIVASSFLLSAILNYALATYLLTAPPGTEQFNAQLGKMTALSFPVIAIPSLIVTMSALFFLMSRIKKLTGLDLEQMMLTPPEQKKN